MSAAHALVCDALAAGLEVASEAELAAYQHDFGRLIEGRALGAVRPRSAAEVERVVALARARGVALTARGGGASQSGQSLCDGSVAVDLRGLREIDPSELAQHRIRCGPGATFRELLAHTLLAGLTLPVVPLNLDLSVGGVLSAGGLGSSSHRHGLVVDHVEALEAVLGTGERILASPTRERDVYDVVLGGVGRAGMITDVTLRLVPSPPRLRTSVLVLPSDRALVDAMEQLQRVPAIEHLDAICAPATLGLGLTPEGTRAPLRRWVTAIHVTTGEDADLGPVHALLGDDLLHTELSDAMSFASRFDGRFRVMRATGAWELAHPWVEAFVPAARAPDALARAQSAPAFLTELVRLGPLASDREGRRPRSVALPTDARDGGSRPSFVLAMLPSGVAPPFLDAARVAVASLDEALERMGAKRYLSGYTPRLAREGGLAAHHGAELPWLRGALARCDPERRFRHRLTTLEAWGEQTTLLPHAPG